MGSAFMCIDVVGERENLFLVSVVILKGDFQVDAVAHSLKIDHLVVQRGLVLIKMLDKGNDAPCVVELMFFFVSLIFDRDQQTFIQKREFPKPLRQGIEAEFSGFENGRIRFKRNFGSAPVRMSRGFQASGWRSSVERLNENFSFSPDF